MDSIQCIRIGATRGFCEIFVDQVLGPLVTLLNTYAAVGGRRIRSYFTSAPSIALSCDSAVPLGSGTPKQDPPPYRGCNVV